MKTKLIEYIEENCQAVDTDQLYDDMLDERYSFDQVGDIFASMSPSQVLKECDPVAYRCGKVDYLDGEGIVEIGESEYCKDDVEKACDDWVENLESELSDLETEYEKNEDQTIRALIVEKMKEIAATKNEISKLT